MDHLFVYSRFIVMKRDTAGRIRSLKVEHAYFHSFK